ncbi:MAG TPA: DUF5689 domain-containing protein [Chitinophagaceae bacterium]|nr:DUF5689 domain-containing protein [Chitinophagaceae bacterium]
MWFKKIKSTRVAAMGLAVSVLVASCDKQPIGPTGPDPVGAPVPGQYMTFTAFRALHTGGGDVTVPAGTKKIRGVVISNYINEAAGNVRLQDESGSGVYLYTAVGSPNYTLGSVLEINPAGGVLTLYNGDLELKSVPQANVVIVGGTIPVTPRVATIAQILANHDAWASTLVKITGITSITQASSNATGVTYNITDATGTLSTFVRVASGISMNTSGTSLTGYVSIFNSTTQVQIRTAGDIQ